MRALLFASLLALASGLIVVGVALLSTAAAFIVGGLLLAAWATLVLAEVNA